MRVQQGYAFVGHTLLRPNSNVNWRLGESSTPPELWRRERPEDEVLRRWKGEMQARTRQIGAAEEAPLRTGGFRVPRLNGNYIFSPRWGVVWRKKWPCSQVGNGTKSISLCNRHMLRRLGRALRFGRSMERHSEEPLAMLSRMVGQRTACGLLRGLPGAHDHWMAPLTSSFPGARTHGRVRM
jgi:hypothetical protein